MMEEQVFRSMLGWMVIAGAVSGSICALLLSQLPRRILLKSGAQHMGKVYRQGWMMPWTVMGQIGRWLNVLMWVSLVICLSSLGLFLILYGGDASLV